MDARDEDEARGPVVTVRSRVDYVIDDETAVLADAGTLADAMYEHLHDQGLLPVGPDEKQLRGIIDVF